MSDHTCSPDACTCAEAGEGDVPRSVHPTNGSEPHAYVWLDVYTKRLVSHETSDPRY